jgi:hypothetical protein
MKDKEESYYRTYKRKGLAEVQKQIQADFKNRFISVDYTPAYLHKSETGYFKR